MAQVRSYTNAFEIVDYTEELSIVPNSWTLLNDVGLFGEESMTTHTVTYEEQVHALGLIPDAVRGSKQYANKDEIRKIHSYSIPHFPYTDAVLPQDIQGKRAFGSSTQAETTDAAIARKLLRVQRNFDITKEAARFATLTTGNVYSPSGIVTGNFFTDYGLTQVVVDFLLGTATTDIIGKCEAVTSSMQDNVVSGEVITGVVAYCSPEFFAKLISHAKVQTAYQYYIANEGQMILRQRAGQNGVANNGGLYREFYFGGIRFIEVRTILGAGQRMVPAQDVVFVLTCTEGTFMTYYGPANKFDYVNTVAEKAYMWTYRDPKGESISIDAETNFINVLRRPMMVVRGTTSN